jgi:hypothetical protein
MSDAGSNVDAHTLQLLKSMKAQPGGKRRSKKGSSKTSKKGSSKTSKKGSSKTSKKGSRKLDGGKRRSKKGSSKKGSRKMKREMNQSFKNVLEIKSKIKANDSSIKDGIPLTTLIWKLYKENDLQVAKTVKAYMDDKAGFAKKLAAVAKEQEAKRAAKKKN